jgi:hypothetical protein
MTRVGLWRGGRTADYNYQDRIISSYMAASGTAVYVHMYLGTYGADGEDKPVTEIQDVVFLENRDRKYSNEVYELRGTYNVQDQDFDLRQFGLFLTGDNLFIEFHTTDMIALLGRKLMPGDVLELPHMRDDTMLEEGKVVNKFYVVEDASRASDGYSSTWFSHIWRVKTAPLTNAPEFADIMDKVAQDPFGLDTAKTLGELLTNGNADANITEEVVAEAKKYVLARNFETRQFYVVPGDELKGQYPWIFAGDGVPPNGAELVGSGNLFPEIANDGDYYLRTDYLPHTLYRKSASRWIIQELDYRMCRWSAYHRVLEEFFNNDATTTLEDGEAMPEKIALSKAVRNPLDPDF